MESIKIDTSQNVQLNYQPAGVGLRIVSAILDTIFVYAYFGIVIFIFMTFVFKRSNYDYDYVDDSDTYNAITIGILILFLLPAFLYHLLCETFLNGQSFGKKIMKIKVIKLNGTQPNFGSYLLRSMFRLIDVSLISPAIAIITVAVSDKSQRFGDMTAGTTVVQLNKPITLRDTILFKTEGNYKIVYEQVALLTDKDANLIKEVLSFHGYTEKEEHVRLLAAKIKGKLGITESKEKDDVFLKTILLDYSHYRFEQ
jgi:uncharacterized RDD family membrane protein YckC